MINHNIFIDFILYSSKPKAMCINLDWTKNYDTLQRTGIYLLYKYFYTIRILKQIKLYLSIFLYAVLNLGDVLNGLSILEHLQGFCIIDLTFVVVCKLSKHNAKSKNMSYPRVLHN